MNDDYAGDDINFPMGSGYSNMIEMVTGVTIVFKSVDIMSMRSINTVPVGIIGTSSVGAKGHVV
jgi:hypothetical protein